MIACASMIPPEHPIRRLRSQKALTQEDLAARSGLAIATIYRAEHGHPMSINTLASIAAALDVHASDLIETTLDEKDESLHLNGAAEAGEDQPYLPIKPLNSGRDLSSLLADAERLDFAFIELKTLDEAAEIEALLAFCNRLVEEGSAKSPTLVTTRELEAKALIDRLQRSGFIVSGSSFDITAYDIDDDDGVGMAVIFGKWEQRIAAIRVGRGAPVLRAYVIEQLGKYETPNSDAIIYPPRDVAAAWDAALASFAKPEA